ncbi:MAG TPA: ATP-binding protein [Gaiellales bacterium]|nr:ATP-binding protein [Gaiellales bacterium]
MSDLVETRLVVPAEPAYLTVCRAALTGVLAGTRAGDEVVDELKLVLSEVCASAVGHAGEPGPGEIEIQFRTSPTTVEITVRDRSGRLAEPDSGSIEGQVELATLRELTSGWAAGRLDGAPGTAVTFSRRIG